MCVDIDYFINIICEGVPGSHYQLGQQRNQQAGLKHSKKFLSPIQKRGMEVQHLNRKELRLLCGTHSLQVPLEKDGTDE